MNHKLLNKIKKVIMNNPGAFRMEAFFNSNSSACSLWGEPCRTTACIAGHALLLTGYKCTSLDTVTWTKDGKEHDVMITAARELGISYGHDDGSMSQAERLFYHKYWPNNLFDRYDQGDKTAAVEMIELIQAEDIPTP